MRGDEPYHAGPAVYRTPGREHGGTGEPLAAGQQPEHAAAVFVGLGGRPRQDRADVGVLRGDRVRRVEQVGAQADVDELDRARVRGPGVDQQTGLVGAEGHGHVRADRRALHATGVGVDAAGQVRRDRDRLRRRRERRERRVGIAQAALAADAKHPVDDQVGAADHLPGLVVISLVYTENASASRRQGGGSRAVHPGAGGDRGDRRAAPRQERPCEQGISAVVAAAR
jgi:hypothetical protein